MRPRPMGFRGPPKFAVGKPEHQNRPAQWNSTFSPPGAWAEERQAKLFRHSSKIGNICRETVIVFGPVEFRTLIWVWPEIKHGNRIRLN